MSPSLADLDVSVLTAVRKHPEAIDVAAEALLRQQCSIALRSALEQSHIPTHPDALARLRVPAEAGVRDEALQAIFEADERYAPRVLETVRILLAMGYSLQFSAVSLTPSALP